jgi:hypothetical protein
LYDKCSIIFEIKENRGAKIISKNTEVCNRRSILKGVFAEIKLSIAALAWLGLQITSVILSLSHNEMMGCY